MAGKVRMRRAQVAAVAADALQTNNTLRRNQIMELNRIDAAYADQVAERFDAFVAWAIADWPRKEMPLETGDFAAMRSQLMAFVMQRTVDGTVPVGEPAAPPFGAADDATQYLPVTPAPWP
jgi:hypothetical protein